MLAERESEHRVGQSMLLEGGDGFAAIPSAVLLMTHNHCRLLTRMVCQPNEI